MRTCAVAMGLVALAATGCWNLNVELSSFGSWGGGSISHGGQTGKLRANYALVHLTHDSRVYFVMLIDGSSGGRVSSAAGGANGEFSTRDGKASWSVSTRNARTGRVTVAGHSYQLEDGAAFLVTTNDEAVRVSQVKIDLDAFNEDNWSPDDRVRRLAVTDERVADFLKQCETPK